MSFINFEISESKGFIFYNDKTIAESKSEE